MSNAAAFSGGYVANLGPSEEGFLMPAVDEEGGFFWEGTLAGELRIQACESCGKLRHPPRPMCPSCRSTARGWRRVGGKGTIWSFVVPHPPLLKPYSDLAPDDPVRRQSRQWARRRAERDRPGLDPYRRARRGRLQTLPPRRRQRGSPPLLGPRLTTPPRRPDQVRPGPGHARAQAAMAASAAASVASNAPSASRAMASTRSGCSAK
jgi:Rubredoxin-like zinc ribbon domain (DUF35_N)